MEYSTTKQIEEAIRRAFEVDRILPKTSPKSGGSLLGRLSVIPDTERSLEDVLEDVEKNWHNLTNEDVSLWYDVMSNWLPRLSTPRRQIVKKRCSGKGWKRIARELHESGITDRTLDRTTLWRIFQKGLEDILRRN